MTLAQEMGIEELKTACEDHVVSTLSVTNACSHLATVMDLQDKPSSKFRVEFNFRLVNEGIFETFPKSVEKICFCPLWVLATAQQMAQLMVFNILHYYDLNERHEYSCGFHEHF